MNKKEFLNELENALAGRLSEPDIREIISDYGDIFDNNMESGKSEDDIAMEIGSPAKIARTILEDGIGAGATGERRAGPAQAREQRQYTDFQKNINEKTSKVLDRIIEPDRSVNLEMLAPMSRRLGAYLIDGVLLGVVVMGIIFALAAPLLFFVRTSSSEVHYITSNMGPVGMEMMNVAGPASGLMFSNIIVAFLLLGAFNLFTTIILWATNGYTPGKWILKMRVVKVNGRKISFLDALLRELVIKCIANSLLSGFLNVGSFIWGCVTDDHKTVHDLVAQTRVIMWERR